VSAHNTTKQAACHLLFHFGDTAFHTENFACCFRGGSADAIGPMCNLACRHGLFPRFCMIAPVLQNMPVQPNTIGRPTELLQFLTCAARRPLPAPAPAPQLPNCPVYSGPSQSSQTVVNFQLAFPQPFAAPACAPGCLLSLSGGGASFNPAAAGYMPGVSINFYPSAEGMTYYGTIYVSSSTHFLAHMLLCFCHFDSCAVPHEQYCT
jgi:hypothetical protein